MYNVFSETQEIPGLGPPPSLAWGQGSHSSQAQHHVLQRGPEVLPPGPAGNGKGIETLGSLPLVAPSLPLSVSVVEQGWSPPLLGPGRSRSRWKGRMRTGVGVEGGQKGKSRWRSVNQREVGLSD